MHYEKPVVMDLSAGARAAGQEPLSCWSGSAYINGDACMVGDGNWSCAVGPGATYETCVGGTTVTDGLCVGGSVPIASDLCTSGPAPIGT
jgi:hypothetical protein